MTSTATHRPGGSTAPTLNELVNAANLILTNCGITTLGPRKINRLVRDFTRRAPNASGYLFFAYLANAVQLTHEQKRAALTNPDVARVINYADPTGETAVNNVLRAAQ